MTTEVTADTKPIPVVLPRRSRRRRWLAPVIVLAVLILLVVAAVVGEAAFRATAQSQIERSVERSLPATVTGAVHARVDGFSSLWQWAHGSFDHVHLTSDLTISGQKAAATIDAYGLPVSGTGPVARATGTLRLSQGLIRAVTPRSAGIGALTLREGSVATTVVKPILGIPVTVALTLVPAVRGGSVHLTPTAAQLKAGPISLPGIALIKLLLPDGVSVCTAKYLPPTLHLTSIASHPGSATVTFAGEQLDLGTLGTTTGHC
ncbi:DUF2993 domain-containing protein [uncultured Amnibacterium sp.]|uniref:LmeA family phospholipid-binding protein n=1 Tax=uncultured Amnibacterium sp. TaxID=1631851 RepID=UPI0035CC73A6